MPTEPLVIRKSTHDLALLIAGNVRAAQLPEEVEKHYLENKDEIVSAICRGFILSERKVIEVSQTLPDLRKTGPTFADWLKARQEIHEFLTGEKVDLLKMFVIPDEVLNRIEIMPVFRPAGATNRMAMDWKVKLGMNTSYEEADVMRYKNSQGPKVLELYYINRSFRPDEDTLGDKAMSPDDLLLVPNKRWLGLYGWSDADNLHSLITGTHLDSGETWTWFPYDRLPGDKEVACGYWRVGSARAGFSWYYRNDRDPDIGARVAIPLKLKT